MKAFISSIRRHLPSPADGEESASGSDKSNKQIGESASDTPPANHSSTEVAPSSVSPGGEFPASGFELVDSSIKLEEEQFAWYSAKRFCPADIGEVFQETYQVVAKLGYGTASTTWLCRDLRKHRYVTVKIYAVGQNQTRCELAALQHVNSTLAASAPIRPVGCSNVRLMIDRFEVSRPKSSRKKYLCLVFEPLGFSLGDTRKLLFHGRLPLAFAKPVIYYMLQALDFLHREAKVVHGDVQEDNIIFAMEKDFDVQPVEQAEIDEPCPRKVYKNHTIYSTRLLEAQGTEPVLCDFGEARFGSETYGEHAMPDLYRAPEILLRIEWAEKIDIWALGLVIWTMIEGTNLFTDNHGGRWISALPHMARMISLLGHPPQDLLDVTPVTKQYFDKTGRLKKGYTVAETSLEAEAKALEGTEKTEFLRFLRRFLQWRPSERPSAQELLEDPWLTPEPDSEDDS